MKQECPTYLKSIGKRKTLSATLNDTEPETELNDSNDKGILKQWMKKRTWWNPNLRKWMNKMRPYSLC